MNKEEKRQIQNLIACIPYELLKGEYDKCKQFADLLNETGGDINKIENFTYKCQILKDRMDNEKEE